MLGQCKRVERVHPLIDERAEREQRRTANAVLAVQQDLLVATDVRTNEADSAIEHFRRGRIQIRRRQMQEVDARGRKRLHVVAVFVAEVDYGADAMRLGKARGMLNREAAADRELVRYPAEIGPPFVRLLGLIQVKALIRFGHWRLNHTRALLFL